VRHIKCSSTIYNRVVSYRAVNRSWSLFAARPLMLSPCLATSPTDTYDVTGRYQQQQHPVTSPLHSPTSLSGVAVVGDGRHGLPSPVNSSPASSPRPWPTSPTDQRAGLFQLDSWVHGSAESLVGQVRDTLKERSKAMSTPATMSKQHSTL